MAEFTAIEWCDSTSNSEMGCNGCELWRPARPDPTSPTGWEAGAFVRKKGHNAGRMWHGPCYSGHQHEQRSGLLGWAKDFDVPEIFPGRIEEAARWKDLTGTQRRHKNPTLVKPWLDGLPRIIFVNDEGDGFTVDLPIDWQAEHLPIMAASPHQYLFLTKRPDRLRQFSEQYELPPNVWAGTSITNIGEIKQCQRLRELLRVKAAKKYVSYEPVLGRMDWRPWLDLGLDWLIVGGLSGGTHEAHPMSLKALYWTIQQCQAAKVPIFVKQDSAMRPGQQGRIPDDLMIRQYPTIGR